MGNYDYFSKFFVVIIILAILFAVITLIVTAKNKQASPAKVFFMANLFVTIFTGIIVGVMYPLAMATQSLALAILCVLLISYCGLPLVVLLIISGIVWLVTKNKSKKN